MTWIPYADTVLTDNTSTVTSLSDQPAHHPRPSTFFTSSHPTPIQSLSTSACPLFPTTFNWELAYLSRQHLFYLLSFQYYYGAAIFSAIKLHTKTTSTYTYVISRGFLVPISQSIGSMARTVVVWSVYSTINPLFCCPIVFNERTNQI